MINHSNKVQAFKKRKSNTKNRGCVKRLTQPLLYLVIRQELLSVLLNHSIGSEDVNLNTTVSSISSVTSLRLA